MKSLWNFIKKKEHREALILAGSGLVVVIGGLWTAYLHFFASTPDNSKISQTNVIASGCSNAVGGSITGSTIVAGKCSPEQKLVKP